MSSDDKIKTFLSDLGRATLRGVRRCPKCGTYNGTRGLSCKNKKCNVVFKEKRKFSSEACKLVTGNSTQVYSVRVRDKGPDCRGFVQLPLIQGQIATQDAGSFVLSETALCFVDSCQRLFDTSILKCHETDQCLITPMCQHIEAAMKCENEASTLTLRNSILSSLNISNNIKQEIYLLASQTSGPLVQRVSKNVMAVKCLVTPKHPLGFLHFSFFVSKTKDKTENKYHCSCAEFKGHKVTSCTDLSTINKKCVHYYACICAFASDQKLSEEFSFYINTEQPFNVPSISKNGHIPLNLENHLVSILDADPSEFCNIKVEVLHDQTLLGVPNIPMSDVIYPNVQVQDLQINPNGEVTIIGGLNDDTIQFDLSENLRTLADSIDINPTFEIIPIKKTKINTIPKTPKQGRNSKKVTRSFQNSLSFKTVSTKQNKNSPQKQDKASVEEKRTYVSFIQWLASVTERINQTMHYQFSGKPEALIFHVPQVFFDCLCERFSCGGTKKRLPNFINAFVRKDAIPLGTFTKYTWHITNILYVKQIFETPLMPLEITKSFVQNRDGTFELYSSKDEENESYKNDGLIPIKPSEWKTYLKVGNTLYDQVEPTPFIIEWIPDILPVSKIGELRIRFEYGHQQGYSSTKVNKNMKKSISDSLCII